jgi:hypothetical protein
VYKTGQGTIFRVTESVEGGLKVEILKEGEWVAGRIGMVGLRHERTTTTLSDSAIRRLPA